MKHQELGRGGEIGEGVIHLHGLCRYVRPHGVWFLTGFDQNWGMVFGHFCVKHCMVFAR